MKEALIINRRGVKMASSKEYLDFILEQLSEDYVSECNRSNQ